MLRRTPFKRKQPMHQPSNDREPRPMARLERTPNYGGSLTGVVVAKGVKAKPGKRTPNAAEKRWMGAIVAHGCVACRLDGHGYVPAEVHHMLRGGVRLGHLYTIPLCAGHHRKGAGAPGLTARHPDRSLFERRYGHEIDLLTKLQVELGFTPEWDKAAGVRL